jgi:hypothetical protein
MAHRATLAGAAAGSISALAFTVLHGLMISDINFMLIPMLVAGSICGALLAWGYVLLNDALTISGWLRFNGLYLILLFLLGPVSMLVFEPVISMPALLASSNGLPAELVQEVIPLATIYTILMALIVSWSYGRRWSRFGVVLVSCASLMLLLGLNISAFGLVSLPTGWLAILSELLLLILALNLVYVLAFVALGLGWLWKAPRNAFSA